jgi:phage-related protein
MLLFLPLVPILKPVMQALGEFIKWFAPVMTKVAGWVEEFVKKIGEGVTWIWENLLKPIWDGLLAAFEVLFIIGKWIWDNIIVPAFTPLLEMGKQILELIKKFFVGQINVVKEVWGYIKAFFKGEIGVKELVWGLIKSLFKGVINVVELVWGYIKTLFSGTINVASTVWEWFKGLFSQGGNYSSRYSRVGDAIIRPNGDVIQTDPNDTIFATKNPGGMGGAITININNPSVRNDQDIRNLAQEVSRVLASQGKRAFS